MAYARVLQHWVEEINPPAGGGPCLLAEGVKELGEEVKCYLPFSDEKVFLGVALPKKEDDQSPKTFSANVPKAYCVPESTMKRRSPKFLGWKKILHPSWPVMATGGDLPTIQGLKAKCGANSAPPDCTSKDPSLSIKDSHPTQTLLASTGIGSSTANNSSKWLCRGDSLSMDTRAIGCGLRSTPWYHAHWSGGDSQDLHHEYELHHKGWGYRCNLYGHGHYLHWEGGP